jgi:hypothetical protein
VKKILLILGCFALLLIVIVAGHLGYMAIKGPQLDASSKAHVDANIQTIISSWSEDEMLKQASKELKEDLAGQRWNIFSEKVKQLGKFQNYEGCKGQAYISFSLQHGKVITALYTAHANFQNGQAIIKMELVWRDSRWQIAIFTVNSPLFSK